MVKIINNIKKSFIYITGILLFIIAIYIMLIPPHCSIRNNKKSIKEAFIGNTTSTETTESINSIKSYRNTISINHKPITTFDSDLLLNHNIMSDNDKLLIMSRCYEVQTSKNNVTSDIILSLTKNYNAGTFVSYSEMIFKQKVQDFSDIQKAITESVTNFTNALNKDNKTSILKKIKGSVYVLIAQFPYYVDNSTSVLNQLHINANQFLQSLKIADDIVYYPPSYVGPISNKSVKDTTIKTDTPISYQIYIIYDAYKSGPIGNTLPVLADKNKTFSKYPSTNSKYLSKPFLDKNNITGSSQCFISTIGGNGMSYVGGCASYGGVVGKQTDPINTSFCSSSVNNINKNGTDLNPWSYFVLYTVNNENIENPVYNPSS